MAQYVKLTYNGNQEVYVPTKSVIDNLNTGGITQEQADARYLLNTGSQNVDNFTFKINSGSLTIGNNMHSFAVSALASSHFGDLYFEDNVGLYYETLHVSDGKALQSSLFNVLGVAKETDTEVEYYTTEIKYSGTFNSSTKASTKDLQIIQKYNYINAETAEQSQTTKQITLSDTQITIDRPLQINNLLLSDRTIKSILDTSSDDASLIFETGNADAETTPTMQFIVHRLGNPQIPGTTAGLIFTGTDLEGPTLKPNPYLENRDICLGNDITPFNVIVGKKLKTQQTEFNNDDEVVNKGYIDAKIPILQIVDI